MLGCAIGAGVTEWYNRRASTEAIVAAHRGLPRQVPVVRDYPVTVLVGSNVVVARGPNRHTLQGVFPFDVGSRATIQITETGTFNLDLEIRDENGNIAVLIDDSRIFLEPGALQYDVNGDLGAYEVVDSRQNPVLQIIRVENENKFRLKMKSFVGRGGGASHVLICDDEGCSVELAEKAGDRTLGPAMFQYPGYLHSGKRVRAVPRRS